MTKDEALKMALEALKQIDEAMPFPVAKLAQASIKKALAQPEQEFMAWEQFYPDIGKPQIEVLKLALEALEADELDMVDDGSGNMVFRKEQAITAMEKLLAQPEKEPVAWGVFEGNLHDMFFSPSEAQEMADLKGTHAEVRPLYTTPPQRKPQYDKTKMNCFVQDLYDKKIQEGKHGQYEAMFHVVHQAIKEVPPQRIWVGLTKEEKHEIRYSHMTSAEFIECIEAKLKEKNT